MRVEEKEVDGPELLAAERKQDELDKGDHEELPELAGEESRDIATDRSELLAAMKTILAREQIVVNDLHLPKRELVALEALKAAVEGRDQNLDKYMYATDRSEMLEQALAILQANLTGGEAQDAQGVFEGLVARVGDLRRDLKGLEDAQDELLDGQHKPQLEQGETDTDDKPEGKPEGKPSDASLDGPERPEPAKPATSLVGPALEEPAKQGSSLTGPEPKATPKPPSTLAGPELAPEPKPPSSLGDPEELAAQAKKPWWRRPIG